jgi:hypothetical protein
MPRWVAQKPCLVCGRLSRGSRCPEHEAERERARSSQPSRRAAYRGDWATRSREAREVHVREHGLTCPGWGEYGPHQVDGIGTLCLDHDGIVLCRSCNSSKAGSYDKDEASPAAARRRAARGEGR